MEWDSSSSERQGTSPTSDEPQDPEAAARYISNNAIGRFHYARISSQIFWKLENLFHTQHKAPEHREPPPPPDEGYGGFFHRLWPQPLQRLPWYGFPSQSYNYLRYRCASLELVGERIVRWGWHYTPVKNLPPKTKHRYSHWDCVDICFLC